MGDTSSASPIFVVGQPRSGSTLLTRILNEARELFVINDFYVLQKIDAAGLWSPLTSGESATIAVDEFNTASIESGGKFWDELAAALDANAEPDRAAFREALLPVWDEMDASAGGGMRAWIDRVQAIS